MKTRTISKNYEKTMARITDHTYRANYFVLPVSLMMSMPQKWQDRMLVLMNEFQQNFEDQTDSQSGLYSVQLLDFDGEPTQDKFGYRHDRFNPAVCADDPA